MIIELEVFTAGETAFYCRLALGSGYDWPTRLADWRRGKAVEYGGPVLLPSTTVRGSLKRPLYSVQDVKQFIADYTAHDLNVERAVKPRSRHITIDTATGIQRWRARPPARPTPIAGAAHA
jgi:hypothetical protein